jgi:hypothetical protein
MSRALHSSSPRGGLLPETQESQGSSNSSGTVDACEWYTFPSPVALFSSWLGSRAGLFLAAKRKIVFLAGSWDLAVQGEFTREVTISNHQTIRYWIFFDQTTQCAIYYVTFTAHHEGSDDRERPWQWPVYRITSCSKRHMSAATLVRGAHLCRPGYFRLFSFFLQCITSLKFCPGLCGARSCLVLPYIDSRLVLQTSGAEADWLLPAYTRM